MKLLPILLVLGFSINLLSQNIGIGTSNPTNGRFVVRGTVGAVSAIFGDNTTGVAIENSYPGIALNTYFNVTRKYISSGFGGLFGLNPTNGDMYLMNTAASGIADGSANLLTRLFISGLNGNIGINTTSPTNGKLTLDATGIGTGLYLSSTSGTTNGIRVENFSAAPGYGINSYSQNGVAIYAAANSTATALETSGKSKLDTPVLINNPSIGFVTGITIKSDGLQYGINSYGNDASTSIYGYNGGSGIAIKADNVGTGNAIVAEVADVNAFALYAKGKVHVQGTLSKSAGSFKIDHPQDPANKFLVHSFVESPDMINVYNGNILTDKTGMAIVKLPSYFEAENIDFKYQLSILGKVFAQAIVFEEIKNNQFIIKTDKPNIKISWMVTGIRNDVYAQKNRIVAEVEKNYIEKGKYLAPELYNEGKEKGIGFSVKMN